MKKRTAIALILITVLSLSACTNPINVTVSEYDKDSNANAHANIVSSNDNTANTQTGGTETVTPGDTTGDGTENGGIEVIDDSWKELYLEFLESNMDEVVGDYDIDWRDGWTIGFIYVNDDDIPEMVVSSGYEAAGNVIVTAKDDYVDWINTRRLSFYFKERGNILVNSEGHMGYYYDYAYRINEYGFETVTYGEYEDVFDEDYNYTGEMEYYLEDEEVTQEEYEAAIETLIPYEDRVFYSKGSSYEEAINYLKGDVFDNYKEAYKSVIEQTLGWNDRHYAILEPSSGVPYLLCATDKTIYIYFFEDGMVYEGADTYLSETGLFLFYPEFGQLLCFYPYDYLGGNDYYFYTCNKRGSCVTYANRWGVADEEGDILIDDDGNEVYVCYVNGVVVSQEEYEDFLSQYDEKYFIEITSSDNNPVVDYKTPEEMYDYLSE